MTSVFGGFFQLGYVTRSLAAAIPQYQRRYGPAEFQVIEGDGSYPPTTRIALGYIGAVMIEFIEARPDLPSIYQEALPEDPSDVRLHHLGYLVGDYNQAVARLEAEGYDVPFKMDVADTLSCCYADTRKQLGHFIECVHLREPGRQWFGSVPGFPGFPTL